MNLKETLHRMIAYEIICRSLAKITTIRSVTKYRPNIVRIMDQCRNNIEHFMNRLGSLPILRQQCWIVIEHFHG